MREHECMCTWKCRGRERISSTFPADQGAQHRGSIPQPWDHGLSQNQDSDAHPAAPPRCPDTGFLLHFILGTWKALSILGSYRFGAGNWLRWIFSTYFSLRVRKRRPQSLFARSLVPFSF